MTASRRRVLTGAGAGLLVPVLSGVLPAIAGAREHRITIRKFRFESTGVTVRPGDVVIWTNTDIAPHTATAEDDSWDTGTLVRGASFRLTVSSAMTARYYCRFHPGMKARLTIAATD